MTKMTCETCLVRHGYATKNDEDRHGGYGLLTARGEKEIEKASLRIISFYESLDRFHVRVFSSAAPQVVRSAEILAVRLGTTVQIDSRIEPLGLGVLSGLSIEEAETRFPKAAKQLQQWREGRLEISELHIPKAEDLDEFWRRSFDFASELEVDGTINVVVGTRSILTSLIHVLLGNSIENGGGYCPVLIPTGGIASFRYARGKWITPSKKVWDATFVNKRVLTKSNIRVNTRYARR